jgi:hypothetical protein
VLVLEQCSLKNGMVISREQTRRAAVEARVYFTQNLYCGMFVNDDKRAGSTHIATLSMTTVDWGTALAVSAE